MRMYFYGDALPGRLYFLIGDRPYKRFDVGFRVEERYPLPQPTEIKKQDIRMIYLYPVKW